LSIRLAWKEHLSTQVPQLEHFSVSSVAKYLEVRISVWIPLLTRLPRVWQQQGQQLRARAGGSTVAETSKEEWDRMMDLNLRSAFFCSKAVLPYMMEQDYGKIVSVSAKSAEPSGRKARSGAYVVSKAGVRVLTEAIAEEVIGYEINVNCVVPSVIDTPNNRAMFPKAKFGRWVPPEEIAETILFLASDASRPIRGAALPVFGRS